MVARMTRAPGACASLFVAALFAGPAIAQTPPPDPTGIEVGIRAGYGLAFGNRVGGEPFDRTVDSALPVGLDVGYRLTPHFYAGGQLSYARLNLDKNALACGTAFVDGPGDCTGSAIRVGADVQWRAPLGEAYLGWIAAGAGVERLAVDYDSGCFDGPFSRVDTGFELAHLEAGAGMRVNDGLVIGPFASSALGLFRTSESSGSCNGGGAIADKSVHGMLTLGVRGMYTVH
jgi:hypothetical protein